MTTASIELAHRTPTRKAATSAFMALLVRDVIVLRKNFWQFIARTLMQPIMFVFVFTYVFPKIGQGVGGEAQAANFSSLLVAGVVAIACIFQGIQAVALPLVQEFGYTREVEDRVMAPLPVSLVAGQKIVSGALQGIVAAAVVFPISYYIPATPVHLQVHWAVLLTSLPLAAALGAAFGLTIGTRFPPRAVPLLFGIIVIPITFLGATYYPWEALSAIPWLQKIVLVNPLVYMSEAFRAALVPVSISPHMKLPFIYLGLVGFTVLFSYFGISGFNKRVLS